MVSELLFDESMSLQFHIVRYSNLFFSVLFLVLYSIVLHKLRKYAEQYREQYESTHNLLDLRDKMLLVVSFFSCLTQVMAVFIYTSNILSFCSRMMQIFLQCTLGVILADLIFAKIGHSNQLTEKFDLPKSPMGSSRVSGYFAQDTSRQGLQSIFWSIFGVIAFLGFFCVGIDLCI